MHSLNATDSDRAPTSAIPEGEAYRYAAFISYRHAELDRKWAKWLHAALETYRVPRQLQQQHGLNPRIGRVFRDEEELPASAELKGDIDAALVQSKFLIVVCSPRTPQSRWVNQEVLRFRELGRSERILALLVEGEPHESFPNALVEIRRTVVDGQGLSGEEVEEVEPLAADVRPSRKEGRGHVGRMARLRLLACLLGVRFDDLRQREQQRRHRRLLAAGASMAVLLIMMAGLAALAWAQRAEAIRARSLAERQTQLAQANEQRAVENGRQSAANEQRAIAGERLAEQQQRTAEVNRADGLLGQGDALALAGRWAAAKAAYSTAYDEFARLGLSLVRPSAGLATAHVHAPPPLLAVRTTAAAVAVLPDGTSYLLAIPSKPLELRDLKTGCVLRRLDGPANGSDVVALTRDGGAALAGSGGTEGALTLWDVHTGRQVRVLPGHTGGVNSVSISPDGRTALSGGNDKMVRVWDLGRGTLTRTLAGHSDVVSGVAFCPDGRTALSCSSDGTVKVWDVEAGREVRTLAGHTGWVRAVACSPDGSTALSASRDRTLKLWDLRTGREVRTFGHAEQVFDVAFLPGGGTALSASSDGTMKLWDVATGRDLRTFTAREQHATSRPHVAVSPDGRVALSLGFGDKAVVTWDLSGTREIRPSGGPPDSIWSLEISSDGRLAISGDGRLATSGDGRLATSGKGVTRLWDLATGREVRSFPGAQKGYLLPDGRRALTIDAGGGLSLRDLATGATGTQLKPAGRKVERANISRDGRRALVSVYNSPAITMWDLETGQLVRTFTVPEIGGRIKCQDFTADGGRVLCGYDDGGSGFLRMWDAADGRELWNVKAHKGRVLAACCPDDSSVISCGTDGTVRQWEVRTGTARRPLRTSGEELYALCVSRDGRTAIAAGQDQVATLWDLTTGTEYHRIAWGEVVRAVAISPDGLVILCGVTNVGTEVRDYSRPGRYRELQPRVEAAGAVLQRDANEAGAIGTLGEWYAFRDMNDWAVELLGAARARKAKVSSLTLARCYWELDRRTEAKAEFERAVGESDDEQEKFYLQLCLAAVGRNAGVATPAAKDPVVKATQPAK